MNTSNSPSDAWSVFDYEVDMFRNLCDLLVSGNSEYGSLSLLLKNAIVESAVLHARILADILLSHIREPDDIGLRSLLPGFECAEIAELRRAYGRRDDPLSPRSAFNKMLAHATTNRSNSFDYTVALNQIAPLILGIVDRIEAFRPKP
jgi:hypothetical protein